MKKEEEVTEEIKLTGNREEASKKSKSKTKKEQKQKCTIM